MITKKKKEILATLSSLSLEQLKQEFDEYKKQGMKLRLQKSLGDFKDTAQFQKVRKYLARVKTQINLKKNV